MKVEPGPSEQGGVLRECTVSTDTVGNCGRTNRSASSQMDSEEEYCNNVRTEVVRARLAAHIHATC